jgi:hypothetical protein
MVVLQSAEDHDLALTIREIEAPAWISLEGVSEGTRLSIPARGSVKLTLVADVTHRFFPRKLPGNERLRLCFQDDEILDVSVTIPEIIGGVPPGEDAKE